MRKRKTLEEKRHDLAKRRVPCLITYLSPFRLIVSEGWGWSATIEEVNRQTWDYVRLHELAGGLDVGLASPYHLVLGRDGALALPPVEGLQTDQEAIAFFNRCLAALLIGGVYCEAVSPDGLDLGSIIDWKYIRSHRTGQAAANRFHHHIRHRQSAAIEAIALNEPRTIELNELQKAMKTGLEALAKTDRLRGDILLKGVTGIARRDWSGGLANLWIVIEQVISHLWDRELIEPAASDGSPKARRDQLRDNRTWTASARLEMLFQKGLIDLPTLGLLSVARKARNDLAHEGASPTEVAAEAAFDGAQALLRTALPGQALPLFDLDLGDHSLSDPFAPLGPIGEPKYWMEIPKLPGEAELEKKEAALFTSARKKSPSPRAPTVPS